LAEVRGGELQHHFLVPGTIISDADRVARVSVRTIGSVSELRKGLGDAVAKDEIVAVIESREVADAKSEFLAARVTNDLQQTLAGLVNFGGAIQRCLSAGRGGRDWMGSNPAAV
jgi:cobalt-zinc-cadmium efflux system membrane fusion protein